MPALEQPRDPRERPLPARTARRQQPEPARGVADVRGLGVTVGRRLPGEPAVVRVGAGTEGAASAQEPGTELLVSGDVFGPEARAPGGRGGRARSGPRAPPDREGVVVGE